MVAATVATAGPRYAPPDATLPPPWRGLVDGSTGYIYYWNPETNVTQYEKPPPPPAATTPPLPAGPPPSSVAAGPKLAPIPNGPSVGADPHNGGPSNGHASSNPNGTFHNAASAGGISGQPKLAAIPMSRGVQGASVQSHMSGGNSTGANSGQVISSGGPHGGSYKRGAEDFEGPYDPQDAFKRTRPNGYPVPNALEIDEYRKQHEISAMGDNVPAPFMTFESANFAPDLMRELRTAGFTSPTPIQAQSWPIALQGRDIVAIAKTGSGKTLGYLVPAFLHLERTRSSYSRSGPTALVLAPTRELATQIQDEAVKFGRSSRLSSTCVYGGAPKGPQLRDIERGADIVIATPGRLNDFLVERKVSLRQVTYLVLDEADRMLDMGFEPQIRKIVNEIPTRRQTLMYTATWPKEVRKIAADLLINPVQVNIGNTDELSANKSITQHVEVVPPFEKQRRLEHILRSQGPGSKVIVFCSTKRMCDQLARTLSREFGAAAIHGDKSQGERDWVLSQFKSGKSPVLVATDVAARGLDIKDIRVVINYDFPTGVEDYVHRIGRTGRAGATGLAHTFFSEQDGKYAKELIKVLEGANQKVPPELRDIASRGGFMKSRGMLGNFSGRGGRDSGGRFGGRGGGGGFDNGRGGGGWSAGGRDSRDTNGGRFDNRDRGHYDRFNDRDRFASAGDRDREGPRDKYGDDRVRGRDDRRFGDRDRRRSYSPSYSRSPSRGRARSYTRSRSRSRSLSYDGGRYSEDRNRKRSRSPVYRASSPDDRGASPPRSRR